MRKNKKFKIILNIFKVLWCLFAVIMIANFTIELFKNGWEGINAYIIFFQVYLIVKFVLCRVNIEDAILITSLESGLCIRYMVNHILEPLDIFIILTQVVPIVLVWLCYIFEGEKINGRNM